MTTVPSNLIPTRITQLPEYQGVSTLGFLPYVIDGVTYKVQFSNIAAVGAVPSTRTITGGGGLTGGGDLSADRVISIAAGGVGFGQLADSGVAAGVYGNATNIPVLTVDTKGRVTVATTTPIDLTAYVPTSRAIIAGAGLTGGGTLAADRTISLTLSAALPESGGTPSAGTATVAAREDHVHPAVDLSDATETSGVLPMSRGGTGNSLSPVAGAIVYSDGGDLNLSNPGSANQLFFSEGGSAPVWRSLTTSLSGLTFGLSGSAYALSGTLAAASGGTGQTTYTDGELLIGKTDGTLAKATLTAGSGVSVTNGDGTITIAVAGGGTGTVTSVALSGGTTGLTVTGSPITTSGTITLGGTLAVANGGTGQTTYTDGQLLIGKTDGTLAKATLTAGTGVSVTNADGAVTVTNTAPDQTVVLTAGTNVSITGTYPSFTINSTDQFVGTVTSVSVVSANGLAGTVATDTTTPAITLSTSVTGIVKGNGTALSAAVAGTDYVAPGAITTSGLTMATSRLLGRTTAGTGAAEEITVGSGLTLSGGTLSAAGGSGTVTSVALSGGTTGLTVSGSPITTSGTITLAGTLAVANGGTGVTTSTGTGSVVLNTAPTFAAVGMNNTDISAIKTATFNSQTTIATTSGNITVNWTTAQNQRQTEPTGTITYTFTAPAGPCHLQLLIDSDGTSTAQIINWPGSVIWLTAIWAGVNNKSGIINFWYDGTNYFAISSNQV